MSRLASAAVLVCVGCVGGSVGVVGRGRGKGRGRGRECVHSVGLVLKEEGRGRGRTCVCGACVLLRERGTKREGVCVCSASVEPLGLVENVVAVLRRVMPLQAKQFENVLLACHVPGTRDQLSPMRTQTHTDSLAHTQTHTLSLSHPHSYTNTHTQNARARIHTHTHTHTSAYTHTFHRAARAQTVHIG